MTGTLTIEVEAVSQHLRDSAVVKLRTAECCVPSIAAAAELIVAAVRAGGKLLLCGNGGSAADCQHLAAEFTSRLSSDFVRPGLPALALTTDTSFLTAYANDFDFDGIFARQVQALGKPGDVLLGISTSGRSKNVVQAAQLAKRMGIKVVVLTGACEQLAGEPAGGHRFEENWSRRVRCMDHGPEFTHSATPPDPPLLRGGDGVGEPAGGHRFEENWSRRVRCMDHGPEFTHSATPPSPPLLRGGDGDCPLPLLQLADVAICVPSQNTQHIQEAHLAIEHILCHLVERSLFGEHGTAEWDTAAEP